MCWTVPKLRDTPPMNWDALIAFGTQFWDTTLGQNPAEAQGRNFGTFFGNRDAILGHDQQPYSLVYVKYCDFGELWTRFPTRGSGPWGCGLCHVIDLSLFFQTHRYSSKAHVIWPHPTPLNSGSLPGPANLWISHVWLAIIPSASDIWPSNLVHLILNNNPI